MGLLGKIWVKLGLDNSEFNKGIQGAEKQASGFKSFIKGVGQSILAAFSIGAIINFGKASVKAYNESAMALSKLESVLRSTGWAAGLGSKELTAYASDLQRITMFEDDATINAMALLATFKSIKGDVFKQTIASAQDLATVLGTDLNGAVMQLGKALEAPEIGLTMLRRSGISFSTQQIEQIKKLVEEGKKHEAQMVMLAEVQTQFGGAAKAAAATAQGAWVQLKNSFGDLMETIGSGTEETKGFAGSLKIWVEQLDRLFKSKDVGFWGKLTGLFGGNQAAFRKANEEAERNLKYNKEAEAQAEGAMSVVTDLAEAERQLQILGKGTGVLWRELFEQKLKTYIQSAKNAELQSQLDKEEAEAAKKKAAAEEAARVAEEKHIEGSLKNLQYLIKLKQEEITLTTDESKRAALNQELANLEHRLAVMKLTTDELKAYNDLMARSGRGAPALPSISNNIGGVATTTAGGGSLNDLKNHQIFQDNIRRGKEAIEEMRRMQEEIEDISENIERAIVYGISDALQTLIDQLVKTGKVDVGSVVTALVSPFGDMLIQLGEVALMSAIGIEAIKESFKSMNPWVAAAAGVALIALGTAVKSGIAAIGASGGRSSIGSQTSFTGGYVPQVAMANQSGPDVMAVIKGEDIWLINQKVGKRKDR